MNTALLIIDIQNDYFEGGAMALVNPVEASTKAALLLQKFREEYMPVIHVQHLANRPGASFFIPGTTGAEIHESVKPLENEKVIVKHFPNSFHETGLLEHLESNNISKLVICGMMTHMCVDATTRAAKDFGFDCIVIGDACATKDLDWNGQQVKASEVQKAFLAALNYFYSNVTTSGEYFKQMAVSPKEELATQ